MGLDYLSLGKDGWVGGGGGWVGWVGFLMQSVKKRRDRLLSVGGWGDRGEVKSVILSLVLKFFFSLHVPLSKSGIS